MEKQKGEIAICITTRNRPNTFAKTESEIYMLKPVRASIFLVDDASDEYVLHDYRFPERVGIPRAKNKCLELAMASGAEHIFLFDDDCYPIAKDWHLPYINSPYKHLCYTFGYKQESGGLHHRFHQMGNGCMMYFHRNVIETIGGFDTRFGMGKFEHPHISHRAHAAGLVPHPFIDVVGSDKLLYCLDQDGAVERTMPPDERNALINQNRRHYYETRHSTEFIPYI